MATEQLYNVYIRVNEKKQILLALDKNDIDSIFRGISNNEDYVWISGRKVLISYDTFKIYDTSKAINQTSKSGLKDEMQKMKGILNIPMGVPLLQHHGVEVTHGFSIPIPDLIKKNKMNNEPPTGKIFVSHSSRDKKLVEKFIEHVLILGFKLKDDKIFCTSLEGLGIRSGKDFKGAIHDELVHSIGVIQIITNNYKKSEVCLNEMGAAWVLSKIVIPLVANPFNYDVGFIHNTDQQLKLNSRSDLMKLWDDHGNIFNSEKVSVENLSKQIDVFVKFADEFSNNNILAGKEVLTDTQNEAISQPKKYIHILNKSSDKALDVSVNDKVIQVWGQHDGDNQVWEVCNRKLNLFSIHSKRSDKCLEVKNASTDNSASIQLSTYDGSKNQLWEILTNSDGSYTIMTHSVGKCLEADAKTVHNDGGRVIQHLYTNGDHQKWYLESVSR